MRTIRRWLRELLIRMPGRIGESLILPQVRNLYMRLPFETWRKRRYAISEARRLTSALSSGRENLTIVYDCPVFGCGYGATINMFLIARWANAHNLPVNFYFVEPDIGDASGVFDHSGDHYSQNEVDYFIQDSVTFVTELLNEQLSTVSRIPGSSLQGMFESLDNGVLLFDDYTRNRRPFFRDLGNVFAQLMTKTVPELQDRILFSPNEFRNLVSKSFPTGPYVSWACRFNYKGFDIGRQTFPEEFQKIYIHLRERFPDYQILIVSDESGCQHYSSVATDLKIDDLLFSKDYSDDFLGDGALIMLSEFFFCFRGGGIMGFPIYSKIPFEIFAPIMDENMWDKNKITSWQTDEQNWVLLLKHQFDHARHSNLNELGSFEYCGTQRTR